MSQARIAAPTVIPAVHLLAPAKLNLYLDVLGQRSDGYHELETLFERIDLADEITLTPQVDGVTVTCDDPTLDCGVGNLATKAAELLRRTCGVSQGVAIHLAKWIPIASGLGGGSSDAATVLLGLSRLWSLALPVESLRELACQLGSDVPFFLEETAFAVGRGRGDACEPLAGPLPVLWHVLVVANAQLSTKEIYEGVVKNHQAHPPTTPLTASPASLTMCLHALRNGSLGELAKGLSNALEPEAIRRCPVIKDVQTCLRTSGCLGVMVSGSGPAVFGLCHDAAQARTVAQQVRQHGAPQWLVRVVRTFDGALEGASGTRVA